jgi:hypothetical protein
MSEALEPMIDGGGALSVAESLLDKQVATAKKYPRKLGEVRDEALSMACMSRRIAETMFYTLERKNKKTGEVTFIRGPSIRLAEVLVSAWGNLRCEARIAGEEQKYVVAEGVAFDLQKNTAMREEVKRRITYKNGGRYNADLIAVTAAAAKSIALRNAVMRIIPRGLIDECLHGAENIVLSEGGKSLEDVRDGVFRYFESVGVTDKQVLASVGLATKDDFRRQNVLDLIGFANRVRDKEITVADFIAIGTNKDAEDEEAAGKVNELNEALGAGEPAEEAKEEPKAPKSDVGESDPQTAAPAEETPAIEEAASPSEPDTSSPELREVPLDDALQMLHTAASVEEAESLTLGEAAPQEHWAMFNAFLRRTVNRLEGRALFDGFSDAEKNACRKALKRVR